ncbi:aminotransferase class V-fold PLP-dependent enzyme [Flammeovirga sp. SJP92]|uniref:aminotransferase class V-fold PLP-dependent enzyme n=1 Tax=Flammeovirga sp. SJP92 TaxID=1775430 RepID=UPI000A93735D|nr:aminotransferase class V-fold PLP-dependent enzyme [Flammeovirga sp. SJP92]
MEHFFAKYREGIIGQNEYIQTPHHDAIRIVYADWTASARMYQPIETRLLQDVLPYVANTHTDSNYTSSKMTYAYQKAKDIIKAHVGASEDDLLISSDAGMTGVMNKLQRILGFRVHESFSDKIVLKEEEKPVVFVTHMEHHSNQTSWEETIADVVVVPPDEKGLVSVENFKKFVELYAHRKVKIASITSCSNVTGIFTPYMEIATLMHQYDGLCFVDFATSAPYVDINMHEDDQKGSYLDAIFFSPHKFLGGPGTTGILVFNKKLYKNAIPDNVGGGIVKWSNPWGKHQFVKEIEAREDAGTPPFLQTIRVAMCTQLKEEMGVSNILKREREILEIIWDSLKDISNLHVLAGEHKNRLGVVSFYIDDLHYNLGVKILNDRYGVQTRGGCSCAGTYGHYLLNISESQSEKITTKIDQGDYSLKQGWIRLSIHPTQTNAEILFIMHAIRELAKNHHYWKHEYLVDYTTNKVSHINKQAETTLKQNVNQYFNQTFSDDILNYV